MKVDFLIVGQGLAGSLLAWELLKRRQTVLVVDRDESITSSKIAAGIVSPVTGNRLAASWRVDEFLPVAQRFYWEIEEKLGQTFFHHTRIARVFQDEKQSRREVDSRFVSDGSFQIDLDDFQAEHGGFEMKKAGWLDVPGFLRATQHHLLERLGFAIAKLDPTTIRVQPGGGGVVWKNVVAKRGVVFCQGWEGNQNPFFDWLPMQLAKGEILEIECERPVSETRIVNRNGWLIPMGHGKFRVGSNYDRDFQHPTETTTEAREAILEKVRATLIPDFSVTNQHAAVRPIIRRSKPLIGRHPKFPEIAFFNGLGSKGVMNGPFAAAQLAGHLVEKKPIDAELDLSGFTN